MPYKKGGSGLNMVVQSLPPGQFTVVDTRAVLNKLMCIQEGAVQKYGPGNFRWVCTVGDLSAMYDEVDPILACDKAEAAIRQGPSGPAFRTRAGGALGTTGHTRSQQQNQVHQEGQQN